MAATDLPLSFQFLTSARIPPELVLKTIQHLPFENGKKIALLRSADARLRELFGTYEQSLTKWFMRKELRHAASDFPLDKSMDLKWLSQCVERYDVVDAIMDELTWRDNCMAVQAHNVALVNAGLLLLYRLVALESHKDKLHFLTSLPRDPLTAIYLALHHATLTARYHGTGWIHQRTYGRFMDANQLSLRNELEFCFAEATLSIGPDFIHDMLVNPSDPAGETTLLNFYHEHGTHDWEWPCWGPGVGEFEPPRTQGPRREEGGRERTLFTCMLERMAELEKCEFSEIRTRVEIITEERDHELAFLSLAGKKRLVEGLDVE